MRSTTERTVVAAISSIRVKAAEEERVGKIVKARKLV
jgi:hypothetical protein